MHCRIQSDDPFRIRLGGSGPARSANAEFNENTNAANADRGADGAARGGDAALWLLLVYIASLATA
eukprot:COSAG02_NODE_61805_length_267_cov_1.125000_1_plen_65_part_10